MSRAAHSTLPFCGLIRVVAWVERLERRRRFSWTRDEKTFALSCRACIRLDEGLVGWACRIQGLYLMMMTMTMGGK